MKEITPQQASEVLRHYGHGGQKPGGFVAALIMAIAKADVRNRAKLRTVYPGYTEAVHLAQHEPDGVERLRAVAGGTWT